MDEPELQRALQQLVDAELMFRRGKPQNETYGFKHALLQETAYSSMLRTRRRQLHARHGGSHGDPLTGHGGDGARTAGLSLARGRARWTGPMVTR